MSRPLLVLRPEPGAGSTACSARQRGFAVTVTPLFAVRGVAWAAPDPDMVDAVMMTSANAARHAGPALGRFTHLPLYAVGRTTAAAAAAEGFGRIKAGEHDGAALLAMMAADGIRRALHLAGADHRALAAWGLSIDRRIVYAADAVAALPAEAAAVIGSGAAALLHSPRAARLFRTLVIDAGFAPGDLRIAVLSPAVAEAAGTGWATVVTAAAPHDDALLAAAARICD